jgi:hypothetical protein
MDMNSRMAMAEKLSVQQLQQAVQSGSLPAYIGIPLIEQKTKERAQMAAAQQGQQKPPSVAASILQQADQQEQQERGIDELPSNLPMMEDEEMGMAGGGIIAFADTGQVVDPYSSYGDVDPLAQFSGLTQADVDRDNRRRLEIQREEQRKADIKKREFLMQNAPGSVASFDFGAGEFEALNNPPAPTLAPELEDPRLSTGIVGIPNKGTGQRGQVNPNAPAGGTPTRTTQPTPQMTSAAQPESAMDRYARMLEAQGDDSAKSRKDAKAMAIIQAGLGMMGGTSPNAFANIAAGAMPAIQGYQQALQGLRKDDRERIGKLMEMGISKEKLGLELKKLGIDEKRVDAMVNYYNARAGAAGSGGGGKEDRLVRQGYEKSGIEYDRAAQLAKRNMANALKDDSTYTGAKTQLTFAKNLKPEDRTRLEKIIRDREAPYLDDITYNRNMAKGFFKKAGVDLSSGGGGKEDVDLNKFFK